MKKNLVFLIVAVSLVALGGRITYAQSESSVSVSQEVSHLAAASGESGKWVAEYGGGATPFRCKCVSSMLHTQCVVGDITTNISLCE